MWIDADGSLYQFAVHVLLHEAAQLTIIQLGRHEVPFPTLPREHVADYLPGDKSRA